MRLLLSILITFSFISCNNGKGDKTNTTEQKADTGRVFGLYRDTSGKWVPALILRLTYDAVKFDSIKEEKIAAFKTKYGVDRLLPITNAQGQILYDSITKQPKMGIFPIEISADSVMVKNIEGILIDSLQKRKH